jgi:hypothetical protein
MAQKKNFSSNFPNVLQLTIREGNKPVVISDNA